MISPAFARALPSLADRLDPIETGHRDDPIGWSLERGDELWSKQHAIMESVVVNRYTAAPSAHGMGKSHVAAKTILWWAQEQPTEDCFVVWTAPTYPQVNAIIGRYLRRDLADGKDTGLRITGDNSLYRGDVLIGYGRKPADYNPAGFQGIHAKKVLVVIDEACGVPKPLWDAVDSLVTNESGRVLAIGNPDDPESHFARVCDPTRREGIGWNVIPISALESPAFTGEEVSERLLDTLTGVEWVEERKQRWGEDSDIYQAKVLGKFAKGSERSIIPRRLVVAARQLEVPSPEWDPNTNDAPQGRVISLDVARNEGGGDQNVIAIRHGQIVRIAARFFSGDLETTASRVEDFLMSKTDRIVVDGDGLGAGVVDILRRRGHAVVEYRGSQAARKPHRFKNRRAEAWWGTRLLLTEGAFRIGVEGDNTDDLDDLEADLSSPRREVDTSGRTKVEAKEDVKKRLGRSPDLGDAVVMALSVSPDEYVHKPHRPDEERVATTVTSGLREKVW